MPKVESHRCESPVCYGHRAHVVVLTRGKPARGKKPATPTTRELVCSACDQRQPYGICCPKCGDCRLRVAYTWQRACGATVRVRACRHCGHRIRTREKVESVAV